MYTQIYRTKLLVSIKYNIFTSFIPTCITNYKICSINNIIEFELYSYKAQKVSSDFFKLKITFSLSTILHGTFNVKTEFIKYLKFTFIKTTE